MSSEEGETFEAYERRVLRVVHEIARRKLEKKLQSIADSFAPRLATGAKTSQATPRSSRSCERTSRFQPGRD